MLWQRGRNDFTDLSITIRQKIKDLLCDGKLNVLAVVLVCVCSCVFVGGRKWAVLVDTFDLG